ncbi:hypothetical protein MHYP_G00066370 [Metynnis hypsauchen]
MTVWHRGLHLKLLRTIPDWHMVKFIMEMLVNCNFIVHTSDGQTSRLRRLKNGVPQGSVLTPILFNIYIHDLPDTTATKDIGILANYLQKWHLRLSMGKTVAAAYHLNNREARRELDVYVGKNRLEFQQAPKYLGVCLDWTLSYKQHLDEVKAKVTARVSLICCLAGSTWGASPQTLCISTQALVLSTAEYCTPAWSRSPHVNKVDTAINSALRIVTDCLKPTLVSYLPVLAGITPASLRQDAATLALARTAQKYDWHILHKATKQAQVSPSPQQGSTRDSTVYS